MKPHQVIIADDRKDWMKVEDMVMACLTRCRHYHNCSSRIGTECKKLGGTEIPKIRFQKRVGKKNDNK
jgi:hypothetical protein